MITDVYRLLPVRQRKRLEEAAQAYLKRLDRAIAEVLAPTVGKADDQYLVTDALIPLYGVGPTPEEAMADYRSVVVEYYESLDEDVQELNPALQAQLALLRRVFARVEQDGQDGQEA